MKNPSKVYQKLSMAAEIMLRRGMCRRMFYDGDILTGPVCLAGALTVAFDGNLTNGTSDDPDFGDAETQLKAFCARRLYEMGHITAFGSSAPAFDDIAKLNDEVLKDANEGAEVLRGAAENALIGVVAL